MIRQNFSIFVWNVQGARSSKLQHTLKEFIRIHDPQIVVLVETKISGSTADDVYQKIDFDGIF